MTLRVGAIEHRIRWIAPGSFTMGSPLTEAERFEHEWPPHEVTLSGYWIGETPVTQALYAAVMGTNPSEFDGARRPVENISWDDCQAFLERLNARVPGLDARLPSEAEWEKACRAGSSASRYGPLDAVAWHRGNSDGQPREVAGKRANELGLYDMLGNVWEWCADGWQPDTVARRGAEAIDPCTPPADDDRVLRGGCWYVPARDARAAFRDYSGRARRLRAFA